MKYLKILHMAASILIFVASGAFAQKFDLKNSFFLASKYWFTLTGDVNSGIFRSFAGLIVEDKGLVDFPNLFIMNCDDNTPFLTLHFPEYYEFYGFDPTTWLPETDIHVRDAGGTYKFVAELNRQEFYIDLTDEEFDYLKDMWTQDSFELRVGPSDESIKVSFGEGDVDQQIRDIINDFQKNQNRKIEQEFKLENVITRCLANRLESENGRYWMVWGSTSCPDCDGTHGDATAYISVGEEGKGKRITSEKDCLKMKTEFERIVSEDNLTSDLLCIRID